MPKEPKAVPFSLQIAFPSLDLENQGLGHDYLVNKRWGSIISIWAIVAVLASIAATSLSFDHAITWFGAILAGSTATVSLIHLFRSKPAGIVREIIYVGGGSYLILAIASVYLFLRG